MKTRIIFLALIAMMTIAGCGVPKSDYEKLKSEGIRLQEENAKLKIELDEYKNGADRLIALVEKSYNEKDYGQARQSIEMLASKHPESPKNAEFKILLNKIEKLELEQQKQKEAEEKERIRLANINNTGIWEVGFYVDKFGTKTGEKYISNSKFITGYFSNTATQNSPLNVEFLISDSYGISIMLYEYAGNNPVKSVSSDSYSVGIKDKDGNEYSLKAVNSSDRLHFGIKDSEKISNILMKGGKVQFWVEEDSTPTTRYKFTIDNADWYGNAYRKLMGK